MHLTPRFDRLEIQPSSQLFFFIVFTHLFALVALWFSRLEALYCVGLTLLVVTMGWWGWYRHCAVSERTLLFDKDGWRLEDKNGSRAIVLTGEVVLWSWLLVLRFRFLSGGSLFGSSFLGGLLSSKTLTLILLADSASAIQLRRLRVLLRSYPRCLGREQ